MSEIRAAKISWSDVFEPVADYLRHPVQLLRGYSRDNLRPDLIAGITVAVILLPQAIAFSLIAGLPPQMGLYAAVVGAFFGALWGSSNQIHTGPANAVALLVLSTLHSANISSEEQMMVAAGVLAVMVGLFQLIMGLARLGVLINFVSHSVVVGFATGAGVLIAVMQINPLLGIDSAASGLVPTLAGLAASLGQVHLYSAAIGVGTILLILFLRGLNKKLPAALISMVVASTAVFMGRLDQEGVKVIGQLPRGLPPLADLPLLDLQLLGTLSVGALAVGAIGLVQTMAIGRTISAQTRQRLNSNQEFVGQGIANIAVGFFSGFPVAGSFARSAVNFDSGAKTPISAIFSSLFVLIAVFFFGSMAAYLPRAALSGTLIVIAINMIDREELVRIWRGTRGDALIMLVTFVGTLFLDIEFAVLTGIMFSFARYIIRTSVPRVHYVLPDVDFNHFLYQPDKESCPQLGVVEILGDLYFGAVNHVEDEILSLAESYPDQRYLLIRMHHVNHCDFSGIHMLETVVNNFRERGGDVYLVKAGYAVMKVMSSTGFDEYLGQDHFLTDDGAISHVFHKVLDPVICIYECPHRVFKECINLPKRTEVEGVPLWHEVPEGRVFDIPATELWTGITSGDAAAVPYVIDVREPREFIRGHVPGSHSIPLPKIMAANVVLPNDRQIVLVCRSGRRSRRAAWALQRTGCMNVVILKGGLLAWDAAELLEATGENGRRELEFGAAAHSQPLDRTQADSDGV